MPLLELRDIAVFYGGIQALKGVSLEVDEGEIVTLVGANGAGKSTILKVISGLLRPTRGEVSFAGKRLDKMPGSKIVSLGIAHLPEGRGTLPELTVMENLRLGSYARKDVSRLKDDYEQVFSYFPILKERGSQLAGNLSGGEQQMLAIARAMMLAPRLLMVDELSLGLAPLIVNSLYEVLLQLTRDGIAILLVEQNVRMALSIAHRGYVLETGSVVLKGTATDLSESEQVREAYLAA